jgi:hypothetical protein
MAMGLIGGGGFAFWASPEEVAGMLVGGATAGRLMNQVLSKPAVIKSLTQQGIKVSDLIKLPPSRVAQILGGGTGIATAESMGN